VFAPGDGYRGGGIVELVERQVRPENVSSGKKTNGQSPNQTYCFG
jgi:hypothetical protein